jgi:hypothetical protein
MLVKAYCQANGNKVLISSKCRQINDSSIDARTRKPKVKKSSLILDGTDLQRNMSFEFVSVSDVREWEIEEYAMKKLVE